MSAYHKLFSSLLLFILAITSTKSYNLPLTSHPRRLTQLSMSNNYLNQLQESAKVPIHNMNKLMTSNLPQTTEKQINATSVYVNVYKMHTIFFNRNSRSIIFSLPRELTDLYYYNNDTLYKVSENTKISMANIKHFVVTELDNNIDSILF